MHRSLFFCLILLATFVFSSFTSSAFASPSFDRESEVDDEFSSLHLWKGLFPFGSEQPEASHLRAFSEIESYFQAMDAWRANLYSEDKEQAHWMSFRHSVQDYDAEEFIHSELSNVHFEGRWIDGSRMLFEFNAQQSRPDISKLGELDAQVSIREGSLSDEHVIANFDISMHLGTILFSEFLKSIEATNSELLPAKVSKIKPDELSGFNPVFDEILTEYDQQLLSLFRRSIPRLMATFEAISGFERLGEPVKLPNGLSGTRIIHRQRVNPKALKSHYPGTYDDFIDLLQSVSFRTEILTPQGYRLAAISYDAEEMLFAGDISLIDGGFALTDSQGRLTGQIIYPSQLDSLNYKVQNTMHISMFGVDVSVDKFLMKAEYQRDRAEPESRSSLKMRLSDLPDIDVSGAFLYFLPTWLIDLLIPGTIETLIADAFEDLIKGNNGEGFSLDFVFHEKQGRHQLQIQSSAEMPFEVIQELLKVEKNREGDEARLYRTIRLDLRNDFQEKHSVFRAH